MMENEAFRFSCLLRLGSYIPGAPSWCPLCKKHIDSRAIHTFSCPKLRYKLLEKHDYLLKQHKMLCYTAGVKAKDHNLTAFTQLNPDNHKRPDLLLRGEGQGGTDLYLDLVINDPRQNSNASMASTSFGHCLRKSVKFKNGKYQVDCHRIGASFLPVPYDIFGSTTDDVQNLISSLVRKASDRSHIPFHILMPYWTKRLSMAIQQGNAKLWMDSTTMMSSPHHGSHQDSSSSMDTHHIGSMVPSSSS
jgi:hypothetical protein